MLRRIIIIAAVIGIPLGLWVASQYGQLQDVTFTRALEVAATASEGEQAPKVLIVTTIASLAEHQADGQMRGTDREGTTFVIDYTGTPPEQPMAVGDRYSFVGHVHGGTPPRFHATQVYE